MISLRLPAGRAYPGALRRLSAKRGGHGFLSVGRPPRLGVGSAVVARRGPARHSPLIPLVAARHGIAAGGEGPSYRDALAGLARIHQSVTQSMALPLHQQAAADRPHAIGLSHL